MRRIAFILADWALLLGVAGVAVNLVWRGAVRLAHALHP